jgi:hypothetical protein
MARSGPSTPPACRSTPRPRPPHRYLSGNRRSTRCRASSRARPGSTSHASTHRPASARQDGLPDGRNQYRGSRFRETSRSEMPSGPPVILAKPSSPRGRRRPPMESSPEEPDATGDAHHAPERHQLLCLGPFRRASRHRAPPHSQPPCPTDLSPLWIILRIARGRPPELDGDRSCTVVDTPFQRTLHNPDPGLPRRLSRQESAVDPGAGGGSPHRSVPYCDDDQ